MELPELINTRIIKHPLNWIIVLLMLLIAGSAVELILIHFRNNTAGAVKGSQNA